MSSATHSYRCVQCFVCPNNGAAAHTHTHTLSHTHIHTHTLSLTHTHKLTHIHSLLPSSLHSMAISKMCVLREEGWGGGRERESESSILPKTKDTHLSGVNKVGRVVVDVVDVDGEGGGGGERGVPAIPGHHSEVVTVVLLSVQRPVGLHLHGHSHHTIRDTATAHNQGHSRTQPLHTVRDTHGHGYYTQSGTLTDTATTHSQGHSRTQPLHTVRDTVLWGWNTFNAPSLRVYHQYYKTRRRHRGMQECVVE